MNLLSKANKLRKSAQMQDKKTYKITAQWDKEANRIQDIEKRKRMNKRFKDKLEKQEAKEEMAYEKYYQFIHSHFSKEDIDKSMKENNNFMSKKFLNGLEKGKK